jgi:hypothetical protein
VALSQYGVRSREFKGTDSFLRLSLGSYLANIARCATRHQLSGEIPQMANTGSAEHVFWIHREHPFAAGAWNGSQGVLEHNSPELA